MNVAVWWDQIEWGGVDSHVKVLLSEWINSDQITIFTNDDNRGFERIKESLGDCPNVTYRHFGYRTNQKFRQILERIALPIVVLWDMRRAKKLFKRYGIFDVLIVENGSFPGSWSAFGALWAATKSGIGVRIHVIHHQANPRLVLRQFIERCFDFLVLKWATSTVTVSYATRKTLVERRQVNLEKNRIRVIHNGVSLNPSTQKHLELRQEFGLNEKSFVFGVMGRGDQYKGHTTIIDAVSLIPTHIRKNLVVCVVGESRSEILEAFQRIAEAKRVAENFIFTGYVDRLSNEIINSFDGVISATRDFEGFGLSIAEAMHEGVPIITSDVGAIREFLDETCALIVGPEDSQALANAMIEIMYDENQRNLRVSKAKFRIEKFSAEEMVRKFQTVIVEDSLS